MKQEVEKSFLAFKNYSSSDDSDFQYVLKKISAKIEILAVVCKVAYLKNKIKCVHR